MTFKAGYSGNAKGRPRGIADKRTKFRALLEPHAESLIQKLIEVALGGDISALKICADRLICKARREPIGIGFTNNEKKMNEDVFRAVLDGRLGIEEAEKLLALFKSQSCVASELKLDTNDPIEASKIYQRIMTGNYS